MESIVVPDSLTKEEKYKELMPQLIALVEGEDDVVANCANIMAALKEVFGFFWVGIYFVKKQHGKEVLVLGPFQGPVACVRIEKGKGVCGTAWNNSETVIVDDVEKFPGHIACNPLSKSEIVVPVFCNGSVSAVIDVDSSRLNAFDKTDSHYLQKIAEIISGQL